MAANPEDHAALKALEAKLRIILPEEYQDHEVEPVSMGSALLKYARDGKVAWGEVWETFCDLAMAGGPPHKGVLLEPGSQTEIAAQPDRYRDVVSEICRGVALAADLSAEGSPISGWVRVKCESSGMAEWLVRAIVMENISARSEGMMIDVPAGPGYRIEKEIKNVITSVAKTCHYWLYHMGQTQQWEIADLFATMALDSPLIMPEISDEDSKAAGRTALIDKITQAIRAATGLESSTHKYSNWLGVQCENVRAAIWMMRAIVVNNVVSRREGTVLFLPVNPATDPNGQRVIQSLIQTHRLAQIRVSL